MSKPSTAIYHAQKVALKGYVLKHFINFTYDIKTFLESRNEAADFLHGHSWFTGMIYPADVTQYFEP